jgi:hypothetical protein
VHEENLQNLQASHRSAADECLMLRYKNSLLERILIEKGWRPCPAGACYCTDLAFHQALMSRPSSMQRPGVQTSFQPVSAQLLLLPQLALNPSRDFPSTSSPIAGPCPPSRSRRTEYSKRMACFIHGLPSPLHRLCQT